MSLSTPAFNTPVTLTLLFEGIAAATVLSTGLPGFDFAIDNVSFTSAEAAAVHPVELGAFTSAIVSCVEPVRLRPVHR